MFTLTVFVSFILQVYYEHADMLGWPLQNQFDLAFLGFYFSALVKHTQLFMQHYQGAQYYIRQRKHSKVDRQQFIQNTPQHHLMSEQFQMLHKPLVYGLPLGFVHRLISFTEESHSLASPNLDPRLQPKIWGHEHEQDRERSILPQRPHKSHEATPQRLFQPNACNNRYKALMRSILSGEERGRFLQHWIRQLNLSLLQYAPPLLNPFPYHVGACMQQAVGHAPPALFSRVPLARQNCTASTVKGTLIAMEEGIDLPNL